MAYTQSSLDLLAVALSDFQSHLPPDQKEAFIELESVLVKALSNSPPPQSPQISSTSLAGRIVESGKTQQLMDLANQYAAQQRDPVDAAGWTVVTVTTAFASSRWLC